jgi:hypothetical protein
MEVFVFRNPQEKWLAGSSQSILPKLVKTYDWGEVTYSDHGKPMLEHGFCSISHSGHLLVVVWDTQPIGFDIEFIRTIRPELMDRLNLDPKHPMRDWCIREAWIKLDDDPQHLTQRPDAELAILEIPIEAGYMAMAVARHPITLDSINEVDENHS